MIRQGNVKITCCVELVTLDSEPRNAVVPDHLTHPRRLPSSAIRIRMALEGPVWTAIRIRIALRTWGGSADRWSEREAGDAVTAADELPRTVWAW